MLKKTVISLAVSCVLGYPGWAQDRGGSDESPSSGQGQQTQQPSQRRDRQRPLFLSGKVILDDGREPGQPVRVELICQGTVMRQEYASSSGAFSLELNRGGGQNSLQPIDASVSGSGYGGSQPRRKEYPADSPPPHPATSWARASQSIAARRWASSSCSGSPRCSKSRRTTRP